MKKYLLLALYILLFAQTSAAASKKDASTDKDVAVEGGFTLIPGDVIQVTVWKEEGMDKEVAVLPDGTITFPLIGTVKAEGETPAGLESVIKSKLKRFIPDSTVTITVKAPLGHTVNVIGQVAKPGEIIINRHMGVMEALSQVGGLTPYASTSSITVLRYVNGKKEAITYPYDDISRGKKMDKDIDLKPGDVIVVPTAGLL